MSGMYDSMYDSDGYQLMPNQNYLGGDYVMSEIQSLKEKVKSAEERQTEQEYWNKLLTSNIRSGTVACMWCIRAQLVKKLSLAFYKWKYTSLMMNPSSRKATPLKIRQVASSAESQLQPGNLSAALENAVHLVNQAKAAAKEATPAAQPPIAPSTPVAPVTVTVAAPIHQESPKGSFKAIERPQSRQSIMSTVMEIQYNPASSAHLNKYLQDTLLNKDTDFDTKRKILLAMSNDIIDRGQRDRASRTPDRLAGTPSRLLQDIPSDTASVHSVAASRLSLSSDMHHHQQQQQSQRSSSQPPSTSALSGISSTAVVDHHHYHSHHDGRWTDQRSPIQDLARSSSGSIAAGSRGAGGGYSPHNSSHRMNPQGLSLDMTNVQRSHSGSHSATHATGGYSFTRSPARGRWAESDVSPHVRAPADFKYLVFKNNDAGNYVRELIASPTLSNRSASRQQYQQQGPQRSSSGNRARTPTSSSSHRADYNPAVHHSGGENSSLTAASLASSVRREPAAAPPSSGSVNSRGKHETRHRINLDTSRISLSSANSVPRFMLPTNSYIKKILSPQEAAQFSILGEHLSGGMKNPHNGAKWRAPPGGQNQQQAVGSPDLQQLASSPQRAQQKHHHEQQQRQQQPLHQQPSPSFPDYDRDLHEYIPQQGNGVPLPNPEETPSGEKEATTTTAAADTLASSTTTSAPPPAVAATPAAPLSESTLRAIKQPHFVSAAVATLSGHTPPAPPAQNHRQVNYDEFYPPQYPDQQMQQQQQQQQQQRYQEQLQHYQQQLYLQEQEEHQQYPQGPFLSQTPADHQHQQQQQPSPHLQEYADLIYSTPSLEQLQHQVYGSIATQAPPPPQQRIQQSMQQQKQQQHAFNLDNAPQYPQHQQQQGGAGGGGGGLYSSYADSRGAAGDYDHSDYNPAYHNPHFPSSSGGGGAGGGTDSYWDEGPDVNTSRYSNSSYQSYQQQQRQQQQGKKGLVRKGSGGSSMSNSKAAGKKAIDPAQMKLFYGHLAETREPKNTWSRSLRN